MKTTMDDLMLWLLYTAEPIFLPTFRNWIKSFEEWEYENGLRHQLRRLAGRRWVERPRDRSEAYCQLSHAGQVAALGNVNPPHRWDRPWDRKWRVLLFDVPASKKAVRARLLRWLRLRGFGFLQNSVWLHPDARAGGHPGINGLPEGVTALLALEARCLPGYSDAAIVTAAWDFEAINAAYQQYLDLCDGRWRRLVHRQVGGAEALRLLQEERRAWLDAVRRDPFLPRVLWPAAYLGPKAWAMRCRLLALAGSPE